MTSAMEKDLSLAEAVVSDVTDSARLEATWIARLNGERHLGSGPSGAALLEREEERQDHLMATFIKNVESLDEVESDADVRPILECSIALYLGRKTRGRAARCSSCLVTNMIRIGDLHLCVKGLLWDEKKKRIHHQNLNFCLRKICVTEIKSACNNIRPLDVDETTIKKSSNLGLLTREEKINVQAEGIQVEGIQPIDLN